MVVVPTVTNAPPELPRERLLLRPSPLDLEDLWNPLPPPPPRSCSLHELPLLPHRSTIHSVSIPWQNWNQTLSRHSLLASSAFRYGDDTVHSMLQNLVKTWQVQVNQCFRGTWVFLSFLFFLHVRVSTKSLRLTSEYLKPTTSGLSRRLFLDFFLDFFCLFVVCLFGGREIRFWCAPKEKNWIVSGLIDIKLTKEFLHLIFDPSCRLEQNHVAKNLNLGSWGHHFYNHMDGILCAIRGLIHMHVGQKPVLKCDQKPWKGEAKTVCAIDHTPLFCLLGMARARAPKLCVPLATLCPL